jgi:hypothetical protein
MLAWRFVVTPKGNKGPHVQLQCIAREQAIPHAHGVLIVNHDNRLLEHHAGMFKRPHRDTVIQPEVSQEQMRLALEALFGELRAAQVQPAAVDGDPLVAT